MEQQANSEAATPAEKVVSKDNILESARELANIMGYGDYDDLPLLPHDPTDLLQRLTSAPGRLKQYVQALRGQRRSLSVATPNGLTKVELRLLASELAMDGGFSLNTPTLVQGEFTEVLNKEGTSDPTEMVKKIVYSDQTRTGLVFLKKAVGATPEERQQQKVTRIAMISP